MAMKESITIENLGPIRKLAIPVIRQMTLLIGLSGIGKSAVMKALAMMRYIFKRENIRQFLKMSGIKNVPATTELSGINKLGSLLTASTAIIYTVEINSNKYRLEISDGQLTINFKNIRKEDLRFYKGAYISETRSVIPHIIQNFSNRNLKLGFYEEETLNDFDKATDSETTGIDFLDLTLTVKKPSMSPKSFFISSNNSRSPYTIRLTDASSGIQNSVPVETIVKYFAGEKFSFKEAFNRSVLKYLFDSESITEFKPILEIKDIAKVISIHLEEPELSLDPKSQVGLISDLAETTFRKHSEDREFNLIMATHSPYIVNYLNVLIERYNINSDLPGVDPSRLAVYKLGEDGDIQSLLIEEGKQIIVDTDWFSDTMSEIYGEYENLLEPLETD